MLAIPRHFGGDFFAWYYECMNYELAKQLKDAGFPQNPDNHELHTPDCEGWDGPSNCTKETRAVVPTLEELLAACRKPTTLISIEEMAGDGWCARAIGRDSYTAPTPTEAVANLWLALNKK